MQPHQLVQPPSAPYFWAAICHLNEEVSYLGGCEQRTLSGRNVHVCCASPQQDANRDLSAISHSHLLSHWRHNFQCGLCSTWKQLLPDYKRVLLSRRLHLVSCVLQSACPPFILALSPHPSRMPRLQPPLLQLPILCYLHSSSPTNLPISLSIARRKFFQQQTNPSGDFFATSPYCQPSSIVQPQT